MPTKEDKLAREIADALNDPDAMALFQSYTHTYSEAHLRKLLQRTLSIPESQIRKTRGALFTYLVTQHGGKNNSRD